MRRRLMALVFLVAMVAAPLVQTNPVNAQDDQQMLQEAAFAAGEILQLASDRKFNAMYDRIHPDAHAVVPRAAAVGAFEVLYGAYQVGEAEIYDGRMTTYTYPVTGVRYRNAAELNFTQPFVDDAGNEQILDDRIVLVEYEGEWRWFFGSSEEFVETVVAQYGQPDGPPLVEGDLVRNVAYDLDEFYREVLSYLDVDYESPGFVYVPVGQAVRTACGPAQTGFWGFFCPGDNTIYVDESLIATLQDSADFAAAFVIAHEWAHYIQTVVGFERVQYQAPEGWNEVHSIELELMADCMAGAWALDVDTRGRLESDDIQETVDFTVEKLGDPAYIDQYDPQAHGTDEQRVQSFLTGYEQGFSGCNVVI